MSRSDRIRGRPDSEMHGIAPAELLVTRPPPGGAMVLITRRRSVTVVITPTGAVFVDL